MQSCRFCNIIAGARQSELCFYEDDHTLAFFPGEPVAIGHTLVISKHHIADIWELDEQASHHIMTTILKISNAIRISLRPGGLNLVQNNGSVGGQHVFHIHFHLIPRWSGDDIGELVRKPGPDATSRKQILEALSAIQSEL